LCALCCKQGSAATCCLAAAPDALEKQPDGSFQLVPLYVPVPCPAGQLQSYRCMRGTNVVENYFSVFHHHCLSGNANSAEHAQLMFDLCNLRFVIGVVFCPTRASGF
jgi:hypothetical protein